MKNLKHAILIGLFSFFAALLPAHAQIPVTDIAGLTQQIQQVASWVQQIQAMKDQLSQQQQLFSSMNGSRGMSQLLNNSSLKNTLPQDWQNVYASVQSGGYSGLTGSAKSIRDANAIYDCNSGVAADFARCNRELTKVAQDKAFANDAYNASQRRLDNIQSLMGQIDNATDSKQIQDLQVRMQAENAMIQNEQTKLMMFKMMADSEEKLINQQKHETDMKNVGRKTRVANTLVPLQY